MGVVGGGGLLSRIPSRHSEAGGKDTSGALEVGPTWLLACVWHCVAANGSPGDGPQKPLHLNEPFALMPSWL